MRSLGYLTGLPALLIAAAMILGACESAAPAEEPGSDGESPPVAVGPVEVSKDIVYREIDGVELALDVYKPRKAGSYPGLLWIHGGQMRLGDKCVWGEIGTSFASLGYTVYAINYRLAPRFSDDPKSIECDDGSSQDVTYKQGYPFPAGWRDVKAALQWVKDNGDRYQTDTSRLAALGASAGGYYSFMLGTRGLVGVQAGWSGPTKFDDLDHIIVENYIGCPLARCPEKWRQASPYYSATSSAPPAAIYNSTDELVPLGQAEAYSEKLNEVGVENKLVIIPGDRHAAGFSEFHLPNGRSVLQDTAAFIDSHL